ncbi:MAG: hypothetical protein RR612_11185, partial [Oscillospiraceae bacterium]
DARWASALSIMLFTVNYCSLRALSRRRARVDLLHFEVTIVCNTVALQKSNGRSRAAAPTECVECSLSVKCSDMQCSTEIAKCSQAAKKHARSRATARTE